MRLRGVFRRLVREVRGGDGDAVELLVLKRIGVDEGDTLVVGQGACGVDVDPAEWGHVRGGLEVVGVVLVSLKGEGNGGAVKLDGDAEGGGG